MVYLLFCSPELRDVCWSTLPHALNSCCDASSVIWAACVLVGPCMVTAGGVVRRAGVRWLPLGCGMPSSTRHRLQRGLLVQGVRHTRRKPSPAAPQAHWVRRPGLATAAGRPSPRLRNIPELGRPAIVGQASGRVTKDSVGKCRCACHEVRGVVLHLRRQSQSRAHRGLRRRRRACRPGCAAVSRRSHRRAASSASQVDPPLRSTEAAAVVAT